MLMDSICPYLDWQTTLAYLKDLPSDYLEPALDVLGEFASIVSKLQSGRYVNEYDFELSLYELVQTTYYGHFRYLPSLSASVFGFGRPLAVVSYVLARRGSAQAKYIRRYLYSRSTIRILCLQQYYKSMDKMP
jgi:hypothetical protein